MMQWKEYAGDDYVRKLTPAEYDPATLMWKMSPEAVYHGLWAYPGNELAHPLLHYITFDFDFPVLEEARRDVGNFLRHLDAVYDVPLGELGVYFSGQKGFHVVMPIGMLAEGENVERDGVGGITPDMLRSFAVRLAMGFPSFDSATFDARRLFRRPGALHRATGRRKTQITAEAIFYAPLAEIVAGQGGIFEVEPATFNPLLHELMMGVVATIRPEERLVRSSLSEIFEPARVGERNNRATQLVGLLTKRIEDITLIREIARLWNRHNRAPLTELELDEIVTGVYARYHKRHIVTTTKQGEVHGF